MSDQRNIDEIKRHAGLRLRAAREALRIRTQSDFAELIGTSRTAVSNWENGIRMPDVQAMVQLAAISPITLEWIFMGSLRNVNWELGNQIKARADALGAAVGTPTP